MYQGRELTAAAPRRAVSRLLGRGVAGSLGVARHGRDTVEQSSLRGTDDVIVMGIDARPLPPADLAEIEDMAGVNLSTTNYI